jgi:pyrroline-5-carboxylate reductase
LHAFEFLDAILTLAQIREGMTVVSNLPASASAERDRSIILQIFSSIGRCRFLDEKHFDACTALSGSGPAFACIFLEAMADGGVMMGLPRVEALELAAQSPYLDLKLLIILTVL